MSLALSYIPTTVGCCAVRRFATGARENGKERPFGAGPPNGLFLFRPERTRAKPSMSELSTDVQNARERTVDGVTTVITPGCDPVRVGDRSVSMLFSGSDCIFYCDYNPNKHTVTRADIERICADAKVAVDDVTLEDDSGRPDILS